MYPFAQRRRKPIPLGGVGKKPTRSLKESVWEYVTINSFVGFTGKQSTFEKTDAHVRVAWPFGQGAATGTQKLRIPISSSWGKVLRL
ncbi:MAG: hypothetical protein F6K55_36320 [Moorea sp. SIO4A3]|nr:hypothetical protein [Moorena sp. SIO4A3]